MKNVESLSATTAAAANDIHKLSRDVLTPENVAALRDSVVTLTEVRGANKSERKALM